MAVVVVACVVVVIVVTVAVAVVALFLVVVLVVLAVPDVVACGSREEEEQGSKPAVVCNRGQWWPKKIYFSAAQKTSTVGDFILYTLADVHKTLIIRPLKVRACRSLNAERVNFNTHHCCHELCHTKCRNMSRSNNISTHALQPLVIAALKQLLPRCSGL